MNPQPTNTKRTASRPRAMRKSTLLVALLGASGLVLTVQGVQCQPVDTQYTRTLGFVASDDVIWEPLDSLGPWSNEALW